MSVIVERSLPVLVEDVGLLADRAREVDSQIFTLLPEAWGAMVGRTLLGRDNRFARCTRLTWWAGMVEAPVRQERVILDVGGRRRPERADRGGLPPIPGVLDRRFLGAEGGG